MDTEDDANFDDAADDSERVEDEEMADDGVFLSLNASTLAPTAAQLATARAGGKVGGGLARGAAATAAAAAAAVAELPADASHVYMLALRLADGTGEVDVIVYGSDAVSVPPTYLPRACVALSGNIFF
jgi:hypothetical protein